MTKKNFFLLANLFWAVLVCIGCSREDRPADLPTLYPVTLTILLDGQPLEGALVVLHAEEESIAKWTVGGYSDDSGKVTIVTHGQFHGSPAGTFKVCVSKQELPGAPTGNLSIVGTTVQPRMRMPAPIHYVDSVFGKRETTPLKIEVPPQRKMTALTLDVHKPQ